MGMLSGIIMSYCASFTSVNVGADLREDLFRKVQTFSYGNLDKLKTGGLITRLTNDVAQIERVIILSLRIVVRAPLKVIGSLIMAIIIGKNLSWILVAISPLIVICISLLVHRAYPYFMTVQEKLDRVNTRLQENLSGIRLVKAFLREPYEKEKFNSANNELVIGNIRANRLMALMQPLMQLLMNAGLVAALWWGGNMVGQGDLPVGKIMAFINYLSQMLFMLTMLSNVIIQISRAMVSVNRVQEVFNEKPQIREKSEVIGLSQNPLTLAFEHVSFRYQGEKAGLVLEDISFTLEPGETLGIMGATGAGKSSLANLIPRFYDVTGGRITLGGVDIREFSLSSLRSLMAVVPQSTLLFSGSLEKNILFGREKGTVSQMEQAASFACIDEFIQALPDSYKTDVNQRGVNFSGGQKQRIALARALVREPQILILDDSTSAVDLKTEASIQEALTSRFPDCTCIIIAQRISSVRRADKILILEEGRTAALGTHEELWERSQLYKDICLSQMDEEEVTA
jgi:ATP-binding cassette subfamily B multidrug efflux pump